jgi:hypothetical protein
MFYILQVLNRILDHDPCIRPASSPDEPVVAGNQAGTDARFSACKMSGVERLKTGGVQSCCSRRHFRVDLDYGTCMPTPTTDLCAPVRQRVLGVLKIKNIRPSQLVHAIDDPLQDEEDGRRLQRDTLLALVIERPVEAVEIQVEEHCWFSLDDSSVPR